MATIKPIEGRSVHQIQSGQVIVDLVSVCKELVENSIDAGATSIEVRFKSNGLESIEVQDNGCGIAPDDYETIALKHYTSKLSTFDDLASIRTFGFRGEALSSLCALSDFHIVTARAADGAKGTKLEFEQSGKLKRTSMVAAKQGTTVSVQTLFHNLPVRRKELEKNIKREYNKVLNLLYQYACISVGVKFSVSNTMSKGKKTIAFSTNANTSTKNNISNVYGAKTAASLIPLDLEFEMDPSARPGATQSLKNWSNDEDTGSHTIKIVGHISRPVVGEGRQTSDRQMYFVNSRPCTLPQVSKAFNEVYKTFNNNQSPFIFADIKLDTNAYDVNVSPDKRTIMLHDQAALLEKLKESLLSLFDDHDQSVPQSQLGGQKIIIPSLKPTPSTLRASSNGELSDNSECSENEDAVETRARSTRSQNQQSSGLSENAALPGFVKASLIERFASRNSEERQEMQVSNRRSNLSEERIAAAARNDSEEAEEDDDDRNGSSPALRRKSSPLPPSPKASMIPPVPIFTQPSKPVQDFNARVANAQAQIDEPQEVFHVAQTEDEREEERIPAIVQTPQKSLTQSSIQNAFDRMRPLRTPVQNATITIGDTTSVSTIGSGFESASARRSRIHTPKFSLSGKPLDTTPKRSLFSKALSGFAAPGTQLDSSDQEEEDEVDSEGRQQPVASEASEHSPPPSKRRCVRLSSVMGSDEDVDEDRGLEAPRANSERPPEDEAGPVTDAEDDAGSDEEYVDDSAKKAQEEARIAKMIAEAEEAAARPTELNLKRANKLFKPPQKKYSTLNMELVLSTSTEAIASRTGKLQRSAELGKAMDVDESSLPSSTQLNKEDPEERLSLTVTKQDFNEMQIIGQFNLGFIIAVRPPTSTSPTSDLFIIDQHASDEKYNFERLSATTHLVSQRLVHPHPLDLTAVETEIIGANSRALTANGFVVDLDPDSSTTNGSHRARLTSLPMSKEVTFTPTDLEELLALILDDPPSASTSTSLHIPRPSKVRKLLASRACRSSVMIGKTLKTARMREIVQHMGSMDKPWSCPHGRPTMRHLYALEKWVSWSEADGVVGVETRAEERVDWGKFVGKYKV